MGRSIWTCACGIENSMDSLKCGGCGSTYERFEEYKRAQPIKANASPKPSIGTLTSNGKKVCKACAEEIQPAALVCPHCRLNPDVTPRDPGALSANAASGVVKTDLGQLVNSTIIIYGIMVVLSAVAFIIFIMFWK